MAISTKAMSDCAQVLVAPASHLCSTRGYVIVEQEAGSEPERIGGGTSRVSRRPGLVVVGVCWGCRVTLRWRLDHPFQHTREHTHVHPCKCTHVHTRTHKCAPMLRHTHKCAPTYMHNMHACTHTCTQRCAPMLVYTHTHTHIHTCTHSYEGDV